VLKEKIAAHSYLEGYHRPRLHGRKTTRSPTTAINRFNVGGPHLAPLSSLWCVIKKNRCIPPAGFTTGLPRPSKYPHLFAPSTPLPRSPDTLHNRKWAGRPSTVEIERLKRKEDISDDELKMIKTPPPHQKSQLDFAVLAENTGFGEPVGLLPDSLMAATGAKLFSYGRPQSTR